MTPLPDAFTELWRPATIYLNTASYGLPPTPTLEVLQETLDAWRGGTTGWEVWTEATESARRSFAGLVNVRPEQVAVGSTISEFAGLVAASLPDGAKVVAPEIEFTSNLFPWMVHDDRGIKVETVPAAQLIDAIDDSTTLVAFSAVQSATGEVADINAVSAAAADCGAMVFVDATQACGWLPVDASRVDFLAGAAYKWLMSPRGTAFLTVREDHIDRLRPLSAGWFAGEDVHDSYYGPPLRLASSSRRFDTSPAWFSWVGTAASLDVLEGVSVESIHRHNVSLANRFLEGVGRAPGNSAIVSVPTTAGTERLAQAGIQGAIRAGAVRLSFHLYNTESDVDAAIEAIGD